MGKRGPKPKYNDPLELQKRIDDYFDACTESDTFPDVAGLRLYLDVSTDTIEAMCKRDPQYTDIFTRARDRRESWLARRATTEPRMATGCMLALKQPSNGGWIDKAQGDAQTVKIVIQGGDLGQIGG